MLETALCRFPQRHVADTFFFGVAEMLAYIHGVTVIPVFQHAGRDSGGRMFPVGKDAYLGSALYQGTVELVPGTSRQRNGAHIVIRHYEAVRQCLERVERGVELDFGIRQFPFHRIGKAEKQRVARSEDHDLPVAGIRLSASVTAEHPLISREYILQRYGNGNPFRIIR